MTVKLNFYLESFYRVQTNDLQLIELFIFGRNGPFNCLGKMSPGSFKTDINKMYLRIMNSINIYKPDLALNNQQWLIWH